MAIDIHSFAKQYEQTEQHLRASAISARNKELILQYRDACLLRQVCGKVRLIRVMIVLGRCAGILGKDYDAITRPDVERIITTLMNEGLTPNTLATYKSILKRFVCYVSSPDAFPNCPAPPSVAWVRTHVRRADERRLQRTELLTTEDIQALLNIARSTRDRALIMTLWETGGRISEIGNLLIRDVVKHKYGFTLDLNGKTGRRSPLVVSSAPYLAQWLANHPFRENPNSPLWVHNQYNDHPVHLQYGTIRYLLRRYFTRAHINKRFNPHLFRHSRATALLSEGIMNESQAKSYFGWRPDSNMIGTYSHLIDQDSNNAILRENNLTPQREVSDKLKPRLCHVCDELNPPGTDFCTRCNAILSLKKAYEHQQVQDLHNDVTMTLFRILVEKGLIDDAAAAVHDAGLGSALKRLVEHQEETQRATPQRRPSTSTTPPTTTPAPPTTTTAT